jgi:hypothetical protein
MTTILTAAAAAYLLLTPAPCQTPLACAIEHVESRGNTWAVSSVGARGLRQVMPSVSRVPRWLLHVPVIGRAEGDRVLRRWMARCGRKRGARSQLRCALRAYACGTRALRDGKACGRYADAVFAAGGK